MAKAKAAAHSKFFELAKRKKESGAWTAKMIETLTAAGKLTEEECALILGE